VLFNPSQFIGDEIMAIAFFITEAGEFYADMDATSLDKKTFHYLNENGIELGRKSSFAISKESPEFNSTSEARKWLRWPPKTGKSTDL